MPVGDKQRVTYLHFKEGRVIVYKGKDAQGNAITENYGYVEGFIIDVKIRPDEKYGEQLQLHMHDGVEGFVLEFKLRSGYGRTFLKTMPNINPAEMVNIQPSYQEKEGKKYVGMFIAQGIATLKWFYTAKDPKDLPPMEKVKIKGPNGMEDGWDDTAQINFLVNKMNTEFKPLLPAGKVVQRNANVAGIANASEMSADVAGEVEGVADNGAIDDLPF